MLTPTNHKLEVKDRFCINRIEAHAETRDVTQFGDEVEHLAGARLAPGDHGIGTSQVFSQFGLWNRRQAGYQSVLVTGIHQLAKEVFLAPLDRPSGRRPCRAARRAFSKHGDETA